MRGSILFWSTAGGVIMGVCLDALLVGAWLGLSALAPSISQRFTGRWSVMLLVSVLLVGGVLGFMEGRLKLR